jgi:hydroxypyruvate reductase
MTRDWSASLLEVMRAAIAAAAPERVVPAALDRVPPPGGKPWLVALGKAAPGMARVASDWLAARGLGVAGGIAVAGHEADTGGIPLVLGDHPVPGARSLAASRAIGETISRVRPGDEVFVLLSGGASSLAAAPIEGEDPERISDLFTRLHAAGLDIRRMNAERRRMLRWAAGRLGRALGHARVTCLVLSDIAGHPEDVGSGPCSPDPGERLDHVTVSVVADNRTAVRAAVAHARALGWDAVGACEELRGEASACGRRLGRRLAALGRQSAAGRPRCLVWGGETTVRLGTDAGRGGRCQELALAAAEVLGVEPHGEGAALLAAGTDGRDGPTDAAGAVVDGRTWLELQQAGADPLRALARHDAYPALDAADALLRTGPTGTNVADVVVGLALGS